MSELKKVWLHTGSNLGNRTQNLLSTLKKIESEIGEIIQLSALYETEAWGVEDQPDYLNQAIEIRTKLSPFQLLKAVKKIEQDLGRVRKTKWGSRVIDIDILFYADLVIDTENLKIPHPRIAQRNFVLIPVTELNPELIHPVFNKKIKLLLEESKDNCEVKKYSESPLILS